MIKLLARIFIKDYSNYSDNNVRSKFGVLCGGFGIFINIILFVIKFIFGTIAASVAMVADAFNNLSDAASSLVGILGFKLAGKKPDPDHPFGHGRIEYISGLIISFLILLMGVELLKSSVEAIINPAPAASFDFLTLAILVIAILGKFYMYVYNHSIGKKINSVSLEATAKDSLSDTISTIVVIVSIVLHKFTSFPVDGIASVIVGLFILKTGIESAKETITPLLGVAPSEEFVLEIEKELLKHEPIIGMHDLVVHDYGPGRLMISLHAEVPGDRDIFDLHDVIDNTEFDISKKFNCHVVIHMDPIDVNNERLKELKVIVGEECTKINKEIKFHDVRMVPGVTHTNLIFDIVKPFSFKGTDQEIADLVKTAIHNRCNDVFCVITVDQPFVK